MFVLGLETYASKQYYVANMLHINPRMSWFQMGQSLFYS